MTATIWASAAYIMLFAAFGYGGGRTLRALNGAMAQGTFKVADWALFVAAMTIAMAFARYVLNGRGLFGKQSEQLIIGGVIFMAVAFFVGAKARKK